MNRTAASSTIRALAGDGDVRDRRALAVVGQVPVAVVEPDLRMPGALVRRRTGLRETGGVTVVPSGLDQQPAGVTVARQGDVPAVLLIAGEVLRRSDPEPRGESLGATWRLRVSGVLAKRGQKSPPYLLSR